MVIVTQGRHQKHLPSGLGPASRVLLLVRGGTPAVFPQCSTMFKVERRSVWHSAGVSAPPAAAPSGVVTFLFTDVEGSTRRWENDASAMRAALSAHDEVLRSAIEAQGGFMFKHTGDGVCAAFASPSCAVDAAVAAQQV